ncbi:hypothetical protein GUB10_13925 [Salegentibacter sp. BLCTC]|uniref:addiction module protein n=1 Tax=Salegentibacter sp. BLCTC TaxID=2697368 RepID=UPI00187BC0FC|nr:addiction module protein [Salegentibacter sp. BLCTC]MBE7641433.1 hypothetical protein [Salegentibacter sp. BLCTC]
MDKNALKIELIQKIIACDDEVLLMKMEALLKNVKPGASEPGENYEVESRSSQLSKEQLKEIERRWEAYKRGEEKAIPWEEARREIERKYGV